MRSKPPYSVWTIAKLALGWIALLVPPVGYEDIIPSSLPAKILAMFTALLGATHGVTFVASVLQALGRSPSTNEEC